MTRRERLRKKEPDNGSNFLLQKISRGYLKDQVWCEPTSSFAMKVILIGLRGSGKTTVGKLLSQKLKLKWVDLDAHIETSEGKTIEEVVQQGGWKAFRMAERKACKVLSDQKDLIVSAGGGTVCFFDNAKMLKNKEGKMVWLQAKGSQLENRLRKSYKRPSLTKEGSLKELKELEKERETMFQKEADFKIETGNKTPAQIVEEIICNLQK